MPAKVTALFKRRCQFQGALDSTALEPEQAPERRLFCRRHGRLIWTSPICKDSL